MTDDLKSALGFDPDNLPEAQRLIFALVKLIVTGNLPDYMAGAATVAAGAEVNMRIASDGTIRATIDPEGQGAKSKPLTKAEMVAFMVGAAHSLVQRDRLAEAPDGSVFGIVHEGVMSRIGDEGVEHISEGGHKVVFFSGDNGISATVVLAPSEWRRLKKGQGIRREPDDPDAPVALIIPMDVDKIELAAAPAQGEA